MTSTGAFLSNGLPFVHHWSTWQIPFWGHTVSEELGGPQAPDRPLAIWLSFCTSGCSWSVSRHPCLSKSNDCSCRWGHPGLQVARDRASLGSLALQGGCAYSEPCRFQVTAVDLHVCLRYLQPQAEVSKPYGCSLQRAREFASPQNHSAGATLAR